MQKTSYFFAISFLLLTAFNLSFTLFSPTSQSSNTPIGVVSADKMNVLYIGFYNPISVAISGVSIEDTKVSISKGEITASYQKGQYTVRVFEPGKTTIYLEGKDRQGNTVKSSSEFRVKRIPTPTPMLGNKKGGMIGMGEFKAQRGLLAVLLNFDIDARWKVLEYKIERIRVGESSTILENRGGRFSEEVKEFIQTTKAGDVYSFFGIEVKGPDGIFRELQGMHFRVKE